MSEDYIFNDPCKKIEVEVYKTIINQICQSISNRFANNEQHKIFQFFDPKYFPQFEEYLLKKKNVTTISELLTDGC